MKTFNFDQLQEGDWFHGRNDMKDSPTLLDALAIRFALMCWGNHDGMFARKYGVWGICEGVPPFSKFTPCTEYIDEMNRGYDVRVYRLKNATEAQRQQMALYFQNHLIGKRYPKKWRMIILGSRFVNVFFKVTLFRIKNWCTDLCWRAVLAICPDALDGPEGKKKIEPTPKTTENRVINGNFVDITDKCIVEK